ncbi:MAG: hypothetical protein ABW042_03395 [Phenylobacterium sp.]
MYRTLIFICAATTLGLASASRAGEAAPSVELAAVNANAAVDGSSPLTAGSVVKDGHGATVGSIERVVSRAEGDRVVLRIGKDVLSLPVTSFDTSGDAVVTGHSKGELKAMARAAGS